MKSQVRIIGGQWRGTKIAVTDAQGLRPTPDRIRETLFNWLGSHCHGAVVLDCFAGSGVLGFEALSRGARQLVAIEQQPEAVSKLRDLAARLQATQAQIIRADMNEAVEQLKLDFDLVFIDPPYAQPELREQVVKKLEAAGCLRDGSRVYFEWPHKESFELPSSQLRWLKHKRAGQVNYAIAEWQLTG
jgi:16S rRNA (guanine966-N2)-methyltransferase